MVLWIFPTTLALSGTFKTLLECLRRGPPERILLDQCLLQHLTKMMFEGLCRYCGSSNPMNPSEFELSCVCPINPFINCRCQTIHPGQAPDSMVPRIVGLGSQCARLLSGGFILRCCIKTSWREATKHIWGNIRTRLQGLDIGYRWPHQSLTSSGSQGAFLCSYLGSNRTHSLRHASG